MENKGLRFQLALSFDSLQQIVSSLLGILDKYVAHMESKWGVRSVTGRIETMTPEQMLIAHRAWRSYESAVAVATMHA